MSALVVDTSSWISYLAHQREERRIEDALDDGRLHLPPVVAAELAAGKLTHRQRTRLHELLAELPLVVCDLRHWLRTGELRARLASKGLSVSTPDAHVAQCTLDLDADLLSEDAVFAPVSLHPGLRLSFYS